MEINQLREAVTEQKLKNVDLITQNKQLQTQTKQLERRIKQLQKSLKVQLHYKDVLQIVSAILLSSHDIRVCNDHYCKHCFHVKDMVRRNNACFA